jgi:hypothetical protein
MITSKQIIIPNIPAKVENMEQLREILKQIATALNDIKKVIGVIESNLFYT